MNNNNKWINTNVKSMVPFTDAHSLMLFWFPGYIGDIKNKKKNENHYTIKLWLYFLGCSSSGSGFGVGNLKDSGLSSLPSSTGSQAELPAEKFLIACVNSRGS